MSSSFFKHSYINQDEPVLITMIFILFYFIWFGKLSLRQILEEPFCHRLD